MIICTSAAREVGVSTRRKFIGQVGASAVASLMDLDELRAGQAAAGSAWDTSWIDRLKAASFRVVFNVSDISDGAVLNYASTFLGQFHEVHGTTDAQTRPVAVFRRLGTPMAFNGRPRPERRPRALLIPGCAYMPGT